MTAVSEDDLATDRKPETGAAVRARRVRASAQTLLVRTDASPPVVAERIRKLLRPASEATVRDIRTQAGATLSSLTAVDLNGLTRL